jgi:hypothetical protein
VGNRNIYSLALAGAFALIAAAIPGCNCTHQTRGCASGNSCSNGDMGVPAVGAIFITPGDVTMDLVQGQPPAMQAFTVTLHGSSKDTDVTSASTFSLGDPTLGSMNGNTFTCGTAHGGSTFLTATYTPPGAGIQMATATIHVRVKGSFNGPDCMGGGCGNFPGDNAPNCNNITTTPKIVYPPDGVLLPPNMSVIAVHWTPFPGGGPITLYELDFANGNTDVRILTKCATQLTDTNGGATGGCELKLDQTMWDFIAKSNRGGDNVKITIRATTDGTCATASTNSVNIAFAQDDLNGAIFYWKSTTTIGVGVGGQIWAKSFGNSIPEEQMTGTGASPTTNLTAGCHGCHALSRDGLRMTVNYDDDDSDDEYGDTKSADVDVKNKTAFGVANTSQKQGQPPGFQSFNPDHTLYLGTNGNGVMPTNILYLYDGTNGMPANPAMFMNIGPAMGRPTMIDWGPDGRSVLFVLPTKVGNWRPDDDHVFGGSIYSIPYDPMNRVFGAATPVVTSSGENNFYPSYSPDGSFIAFNRVPLTGTVATIDTCTPTTMGAKQLCPNDSFSNPATRVLILSTKAGAMAIDAEKANGSPVSGPIAYSNSWPRWSPFVQMYKGSRLLWITFSSTRDYGLRVRNHQPNMFQCYPSDSLEDPGGQHQQPFPAGCQQPQIFMAAINLSTAEVSAGGDPSYPAFWLPFQAEVDAMNRPTHNHTAQWTSTVATQPQPDMGVCIPTGQSCAANPNACCTLYCNANGMCDLIP